MAKSIENKDDITFNEFRAWMTGLIRGKRGALPDLEDWKQIKIMMDKVEEGKKSQDFPLQPTYDPYHPPIFIDPPRDNTKYDPFTTWCTTESTDFSFGDMNIEIPELKDPAVGDVSAFTTGNLQSREDFDKNVNEFNAAMNELLKTKEEK